MTQRLLRTDLIYPELSYDDVGCAYAVFNELGFGHPEKFYQRAFTVELKKKNIPFKEQVYYPLKYKDEIVGKQFFDFLIEDKLILELKKNNHFSKQHIDQVNEYLRISELKLAILVNFTPNGIIYKRLVNIIEN